MQDVFDFKFALKFVNGSENQGGENLASLAQTGDVLSLVIACILFVIAISAFVIWFKRKNNHFVNAGNHMANSHVATKGITHYFILAFSVLALVLGMLFFISSPTVQALAAGEQLGVPVLKAYVNDDGTVTVNPLRMTNNKGTDIKALSSNCEINGEAFEEEGFQSSFVNIDGLGGKIYEKDPYFGQLYYTKDANNRIDEKDSDILNISLSGIDHDLAKSYIGQNVYIAQITFEDAVVPIPEVSELTYNGDYQQAVPENAHCYNIVTSEDDPSIPEECVAYAKHASVIDVEPIPYQSGIKLNPGFIWDDKTEDAQIVDWTIGQAPLYVKTYSGEKDYYPDTCLDLGGEVEGFQISKDYVEDPLNPEEYIVQENQEWAYLATYGTEEKPEHYYQSGINNFNLIFVGVIPPEKQILALESDYYVAETDLGNLTINRVKLDVDNRDQEYIYNNQEQGDYVKVTGLEEVLHPDNPDTWVNTFRHKYTVGDTTKENAPYRVRNVADSCQVTYEIQSYIPPEDENDEGFDGDYYPVKGTYKLNIEPRSLKDLGPYGDMLGKLKDGFSYNLLIDEINTDVPEITSDNFSIKNNYFTENYLESIGGKITPQIDDKIMINYEDDDGGWGDWLYVDDLTIEGSANSVGDYNLKITPKISSNYCDSVEVPWHIVHTTKFSVNLESYYGDITPNIYCIPTNVFEICKQQLPPKDLIKVANENWLKFDNTKQTNATWESYLPGEDLYFFNTIPDPTSDSLLSNENSLIGNDIRFRCSYANGEYNEEIWHKGSNMNPKVPLNSIGQYPDSVVIDLVSSGYLIMYDCDFPIVSLPQQEFDEFEEPPADVWVKPVNGWSSDDDYSYIDDEGYSRWWLCTWANTYFPIGTKIEAVDNNNTLMRLTYPGTTDGWYIKIKLSEWAIASGFYNLDGLGFPNKTYTVDKIPWQPSGIIPDEPFIDLTYSINHVNFSEMTVTNRFDNAPIYKVNAQYANETDSDNFNCLAYDVDEYPAMGDSFFEGSKLRVYPDYDSREGHNSVGFSRSDGYKVVVADMNNNVLSSAINYPHNNSGEYVEITVPDQDFKIWIEPFVNVRFNLSSPSSTVTVDCVVYVDGVQKYSVSNYIQGQTNRAIYSYLPFGTEVIADNQNQSLYVSGLNPADYGYPTNKHMDIVYKVNLRDGMTFNGWDMPVFYLNAPFDTTGVANYHNYHTFNVGYERHNPKLTYDNSQVHVYKSNSLEDNPSNEILVDDSFKPGEDVVIAVSSNYIPQGVSYAIKICPTGEDIYSGDKDAYWCFATAGPQGDANTRTHIIPMPDYDATVVVAKWNDVRFADNSSDIISEYKGSDIKGSLELKMKNSSTGEVEDVKGNLEYSIDGSPWSLDIPVPQGTRFIQDIANNLEVNWMGHSLGVVRVTAKDSAQAYFDKFDYATYELPYSPTGQDPDPLTIDYTLKETSTKSNPKLTYYSNQVSVSAPETDSLVNSNAGEITETTEFKPGEEFVVDIEEDFVPDNSVYYIKVYPTDKGIDYGDDVYWCETLNDTEGKTHKIIMPDFDATIIVAKLEAIEMDDMTNKEDANKPIFHPYGGVKGFGSLEYLWKNIETGEITTVKEEGIFSFDPVGKFTFDMPQGTKLIENNSKKLEMYWFGHYIGVISLEPEYEAFSKFEGFPQGRYEIPYVPIEPTQSNEPLEIKFNLSPVGNLSTDYSKVVYAEDDDTKIVMNAWKPTIKWGYDKTFDYQEEIKDGSYVLKRGNLFYCSPTIESLPDWAVPYFSLCSSQTASLDSDSIDNNKYVELFVDGSTVPLTLRRCDAPETDLDDWSVPVPVQDSAITYLSALPYQLLDFDLNPDTVSKPGQDVTFSMSLFGNMMRFCYYLWSEKKYDFATPSAPTVPGLQHIYIPQGTALKNTTSQEGKPLADCILRNLVFEGIVTKLGIDYPYVRQAPYPFPLSTNLSISLKGTGTPCLIYWEFDNLVLGKLSKIPWNYIGPSVSDLSCNDNVCSENLQYGDNLSTDVENAQEGDEITFRSSNEDDTAIVLYRKESEQSERWEFYKRIELNVNHEASFQMPSGLVNVVSGGGINEVEINKGENVSDFSASASREDTIAWWDSEKNKLCVPWGCGLKIQNGKLQVYTDAENYFEEWSFVNSSDSSEMFVLSFVGLSSLTDIMTIEDNVSLNLDINKSSEYVESLSANSSSDEQYMPAIQDPVTGYNFTPPVNDNDGYNDVSF